MIDIYKFKKIKDDSGNSKNGNFNFKVNNVTNVSVDDISNINNRYSGLGLNNLNTINKIKDINEVNMDFNNKFYGLENNENNNDDIQEYSNNKILKAFMGLESGGRNLAPNSSGYEGIFQFRYRKGDDGYKYAKRLGVTPEQIRNNKSLQFKMMNMALEDYSKQLKRVGIKPTPYNLYVRHNQGLGGAMFLLKGKLPKGLSTKTIMRNIKNQGVSGNDIEELVNNYHNKFKTKFYKFYK